MPATTQQQPELHATARAWYAWRETASTDALEAARLEATKVQIGANSLRDQIQADFVIETIDAELTDRFEVAA